MLLIPPCKRAEECAGAIFAAAGAEKLQTACNTLAPIQIDKAVITPGFNLPAKYVIHTTGPVYHDGQHGEAELLYNCYINSLKLAAENKCQSIAFPLISSGIFGYPKADALKVGTRAILDFLSDHDMDVYLVVFDKAAFSVSTQLLGDVKSYIDQYYVDERFETRRRRKLLDVERSALLSKEMCM